MTLQKFKEEIEEYGDRLLSGLDEKIERLEKRFIEKKFTGIEFEDFIFKFKKRLERVERQKFGYNFSTDDDGKNN